MLPTQLIESALSLTGKTGEDMEEYIGDAVFEFSIEKFCYYLLSPEFIEKFTEIRSKSMEKLISENGGNKVTMVRQPIFTAGNIGEAIYEYQKGNPEPLISLLEKIGK